MAALVLLGATVVTACSGGGGSPAAAPAATELGPSVVPPEEPETGEVARFWFARPGDNQVSVGPFAIARDELVVRGACRSHTGRLTWRVFDNSSEVDSAEDLEIVDEGDLVCDGTTQQATSAADPGRELAILGVTGTGDDDEGESAWLTLANE